MSSIRRVLSRATRKHGAKFLVQYAQVPFGIGLLLLYAWAVDLVIQQLPFSFPAPVICMIGFLLLLVILDLVAPNRGLALVVTVMEPSCTWVLLNMGLFFTPSFILIPSRRLLPGREIGLVAAVFTFTLVMCLVFNVVVAKVAVRIFLRPNNPPVEFAKPSDNDDPEKGQRFLDAKGKVTVTIPERTARRFARRPRANSDATLVRTWTRADTRSFGGLSMSRTPTLTVPQTINEVTRPKSAGEQTIVQSQPVSSDIEAAQNDRHPSAGSQPEGLSAPCEETLPEPSTAAPDPTEYYADLLIKWIDPLFYFALAVPIGIPMFYAHGGNLRSLPLFLGVTALAWLLSTRLVPPAAKRWAHPIITTSLISLFACWGLGAIKGLSIKQMLSYYSRSATYVRLFAPNSAFRKAPGAGDVLSSILDAGIVALALPLFQYRQDMYRNAAALACVILPNCVLSLFFWPYLAGAIGLTAPQALAFAGRFMSTPLAIELVQLSGGDEGLTVVLVCVTGIVTVILKDYVFRLMRVKIDGDDDYFVQGVTVGVIAGAIGTSSFAGAHPRTMATSTISFALFGLVLLICVAVPVVASYIATVAGA